jgi:glycosyltransferase involved in cell wall biosynthesis
MQNAVRREDAVIMRVGSTLANVLTPVLLRAGHPFGIEVVGDPDETFSRGGVKHPLRAVFRIWFTRALRQQCRMACAVAYVTEERLQRRYPASPPAFTTHYSSIELSDDAIAGEPRKARPPEGRFRLVLIGSLEQLYKGPDVLLRAMARPELRQTELRIVGTGRHLEELKVLAASLGLSDRVTFTGQLSPGKAVQAELDWADLFVLPSRTEGLPRALIEAMARGMPAVGSTAGGIPELLPPDTLFRPGDPVGLARKIAEVIADPSRREKMGARNHERAKSYRESILRQRRVAMYRHVAQRTAPFVDPADAVERS